MITFKIALPEHTSAIIALYSSVRSHLNGKNILQWPPNYPSDSIAKKDIHAKELIIGWNQNLELVGCFTLNLTQDEQYERVGWKYANESSPAVLHRFIVDPNFQGKGLGTIFMNEIEDRAKRLGATALRLDTYLANKASNAVYLKMGYQLADGCCFFHGRVLPFLCYEKNLLAQA